MRLNILRLAIVVVAFAGLSVRPVTAFEIVVDYAYDTQGFFDDLIRREAMEAVAGRFSRVITSELLAVGPVLDLGRPTNWRIGFDHPGNGGLYQISTAADKNSDALYDISGDEAEEYGFPGLEADQWILFAGGRDVGGAGLGGTATGLNFDNVFDAIDGPMHRGVIDNTPGQSARDLPAWGGAVSFNPSLNWNFDLDEGAGSGEIDFYSIALHEVGHALGLSNGWNQWESNVAGTQYRGENAIAAYNSDIGASLSYLSTQSVNDLHWQDGVYQSRIFSLGEPNLAGTVGNGLQDLLLEPVSNFSLETRRFELTNVDAAALVDVGWSILEDTGNPLDLNGDGGVGPDDIDLACTAGNELQPYFTDLNSLLADLDISGEVGFGDFLILSGNFGKSATHLGGDLTCDGWVGFDDFLVLSSVFGRSTSQIRVVPEPSGLQLALCVVPLVVSFRWRFRSVDPPGKE